jgi:gluconokinase
MPVRHFSDVWQEFDSGFMIIVFMGVSGSGKSTMGMLLAERLGWTFYEGDDFHPAGNIEKMSSGIALSDGDRMPWLTRIKDELDACSGNGSSAVLACSALRRQYRAILSAGMSDIRFVYLKGELEVIRDRMSARRDHYMKSHMLESQLASLEEPDTAIVADIRDTPEDIVSHVIRELGRVATEQ